MSSVFLKLGGRGLVSLDWAWIPVNTESTVGGDHVPERSSCLLSLLSAFGVEVRNHTIAPFLISYLPLLHPSSQPANPSIVSQQRGIRYSSETKLGKHVLMLAISPVTS